MNLQDVFKHQRNILLVVKSNLPQDKTVTWFWRLREIFDGQKTKGDRLPLENMLEGLISQVYHKEYDQDKDRLER